MKRSRMLWIRPIFTNRRQQGEYHNLFQEMRLSDAESHFRYFKMSMERFDSLLEAGPFSPLGFFFFFDSCTKWSLTFFHFLEHCSTVAPSPVIYNKTPVMAVN